jgi:hypothetical protein
MQRVLIASGVLGLGTALVFGAAAVTATLFPKGPMVAAGMNEIWMRNGGGVMMGVGKPMPMPAPGFAIDDGKDVVDLPDVQQ